MMKMSQWKVSYDNGLRASTIQMFFKGSLIKLVSFVLWQRTLRHSGGGEPARVCSCKIVRQSFPCSAVTSWTVWGYALAKVAAVDCLPLLNSSACAARKPRCPLLKCTGSLVAVP